MLPDLPIAVFLALCLLSFCSANLYNLKRYSGGKKRVKYKAEVERPKGLIFTLSALGTVVFFLESFFYILLVFAGFQTTLHNSFLQLRFPFDSWVQLAGILMTVFGYFLFVWCVLARGRYATSWAMPEGQRLVMWGPYRYVRHPSYLAYFILFTGLFLTLLSLVALVPFVAVPGYAHIATVEEELLVERFGEAYIEYQHTTGKFFPKMKKS
jgi:protein-S-isoprenylcysteine O-methyltransferase Ste14